MSQKVLKVVFILYLLCTLPATLQEMYALTTLPVHKLHSPLPVFQATGDKP